MRIIILFLASIGIIGSYYISIWMSNILFTIVSLNVFENLFMEALLPPWVDFLIKAITTMPVMVFAMSGFMFYLEKEFYLKWDWTIKLLYTIITFFVLISCEIRLTEHLPEFLQNIGIFLHDKCKLMVWRPMSRLGIEDGLGTELTLFDISLGISYILTLLSVNLPKRDYHEEFYDELHTSW